MDLIWTIFIIGGILSGVFLGRIDSLTLAAINGGKNAVELAITMMGVIAMWSGILKIAEKAGLVEVLTKKMTPILNILFPGVPKNHKAREYIALNFIANFLGLGWAATPAGLMAMKELQKLNKEKTKATQAMCMFLTVNMSSLQLITVNIIAYRTKFNSSNPTEIIGVGIIATTITTLVGIIAAKAFEKLGD